jgi:hypothetical protein
MTPTSLSLAALKFLRRCVVEDLDYKKVRHAGDNRHLGEVAMELMPWISACVAPRMSTLR